jgi:hypothetical protein
MARAAGMITLCSFFRMSVPFSDGKNLPFYLCVTDDFESSEFSREFSRRCAVSRPTSAP